jgi:hypothetical protein
VIAGWFLSHWLPAQAEPAALLSLGRVGPDERIEEVIQFNNPTAEVLQIDRIRSTYPLKAVAIERTIGPNAEGGFRLGLEEDRQPGEFSGEIQIVFTNPAYPSLTFTVEAYFVPAIEFEPFPGFFVATHAGKQNTGSVEVINNRKQPLIIEAAETHSQRFTTQLVELEPGRRYRVNLVLDGKAQAGSLSENVFLRTDPPMEAPLTLKANTMIRERVYHFPDSIDMGALPLRIAQDRNLAESYSQTLMIYRPDTTDFKANAITDLGFIDIKGEPGPNGDRYQFTLTLAPEKIRPGKIEGVIRIQTNDPEFEVFEVPVTGHVLE